MLPLDRLVHEPGDLAVAASFRRLTEAIRSGDQARIDLVLAEISGLAASEGRRLEVGGRKTEKESSSPPSSLFRPPTS